MIDYFNKPRGKYGIYNYINSPQVCRVADFPHELIFAGAARSDNNKQFYVVDATKIDENLKKVFERDIKNAMKNGQYLVFTNKTKANQYLHELKENAWNVLDKVKIAHEKWKKEKNI